MWRNFNWQQTWELHCWTIYLLKIYPSNFDYRCDGCFPVDESSGLIFPRNFCNFVSSEDELINKVFLNIIHNNKNHKWLSERAILTAKNKDVDDFNFVIRNQIIGTLHSFKSIDCLTYEDKVTNYPSEFLNSSDLPRLLLHNLQLNLNETLKLPFDVCLFKHFT